MPINNDDQSSTISSLGSNQSTQLRRLRIRLQATSLQLLLLRIRLRLKNINNRMRLGQGRRAQENDEYEKEGDYHERERDDKYEIVACVRRRDNGDDAHSNERTAKPPRPEFFLTSRGSSNDNNRSSESHSAISVWDAEEHAEKKCLIRLRNTYERLTQVVSKLRSMADRDSFASPEPAFELSDDSSEDLTVRHGDNQNGQKRRGRLPRSTVPLTALRLTNLQQESSEQRVLRYLAQQERQRAISASLPPIAESEQEDRDTPAPAVEKQAGDNTERSPSPQESAVTTIKAGPDTRNSEQGISLSFDNERSKPSTLPRREDLLRRLPRSERAMNLAKAIHGLITRPRAAHVATSPEGDASLLSKSADSSEYDPVPMAMMRRVAQREGLQEDQLTALADALAEADRLAKTEQRPSSSPNDTDQFSPSNIATRTAFHRAWFGSQVEEYVTANEHSDGGGGAEETKGGRAPGDAPPTSPTYNVHDADESILAELAAALKEPGVDPGVKERFVTLGNMVLVVNQKLFLPTQKDGEAKFLLTENDNREIADIIIAVGTFMSRLDKGICRHLEGCDVVMEELPRIFRDLRENESWASLELIHHRMARVVIRRVGKPRRVEKRLLLAFRAVYNAYILKPFREIEKKQLVVSDDDEDRLVEFPIDLATPINLLDRVIGEAIEDYQEFLQMMKRMRREFFRPVERRMAALKAKMERDRHKEADCEEQLTFF